jgi:zinc protease
MGNRRFGVPLLLACALAAVAAAPLAAQVFPYDYRRIELPNGLAAYFVNTGPGGQIAYVSVVRTGSRDEVEPGRTGFAHFFEHMMFRGTERFPVFDDVISEMGAATNAYTWFDETVYHIVASSHHLDRIAEVEADRFRNLRYSEADFRTEAGAVLGEYQQSATTPSGFLNEKVRETAFDLHTYRHTTIGYEADVRAMPEGFEYSLDFYRRHYRPENVVILIAGDFDFAEAERSIRRHYSDWQRGYVPPQIPEEPPQTAPRERTVIFPGRTLPTLSFNWKAPAWEPRDRLAVATEVLGRVAFGSNSDLFRQLVIRERKVGALQASFGLRRDPYLLSVTTTVLEPADIDYVNGEILRTAQRFQTELVDERTLADVKSNMKYGFLMGLETPQNVAFSLVQPIVNTGGLESLEAYSRTLDAVTAEDVRTAARHFLTDARRTTVTMLQREGM